MTLHSPKWKHRQQLVHILLPFLIIFLVLEYVCVFACGKALNAGDTDCISTYITLEAFVFITNLFKYLFRGRDRHLDSVNEAYSECSDPNSIEYKEAFDFC